MHIRTLILGLFAALALIARSGIAQIEIKGMVWLVTPEGTGSIGADGAEGTHIDIEDDLGYRDEEGVPGAGILFGNTHQLGADFIQIDISADNTVDRNIRYEDLIFPVNTDVSSSLEATVIRGYYQFNFGNDTGSGGILIGGQYVDLSARASAVDVGTATANVQAGMPLIGGFLHFVPFPHLDLRGSAVGISWDFEDVEATFIDAEGSITLTMDPGLFIGAGYRYLVIDAEDSSEPIKVDLTFSGPFALLGLQW